MSLKTIFTVLLLGSSSVAVAQPMVRDHRHNGFTSSGGYQVDVAAHVHLDAQVGFDGYHDERYGDRRNWNRGRSQGFGHGRFEGRPMLLAPASQMSLSNDGHAYTRIDPRIGVITTLEIDGLGGAQDVDSIHLQLADGSSETIDVRRQLDARNPILRIDLGRRGVALNGIYVYGYSHTRTALQITGTVR